MSNIGWNRLNPTPRQSSTIQTNQDPVEKHEYLPAMRTPAEANEAQKETIRRFNSMRSMLIKHKLMDGKEEEGA